MAQTSWPTFKWQSSWLTRHTNDGRAKKRLGNKEVCSTCVFCNIVGLQIIMKMVSSLFDRYICFVGFSINSTTAMWTLKMMTKRKRHQQTYHHKHALQQYSVSKSRIFSRSSHHSFIVFKENQIDIDNGTTRKGLLLNSASSQWYNMLNK